ncbi:hypothetical protein CSPX01_00389 [Colletotrichum filicis]|nr:hypothetical protein CSPX01_00389 [Colletotrichum filicis]
MVTMERLKKIRPSNRQLRSRAAATANPTFTAVVNLTLAVVVIPTLAPVVKPSRDEKEEGTLLAESVNHTYEVLDPDMPVPQ